MLCLENQASVSAGFHGRFHIFLGVTKAWQSKFYYGNYINCFRGISIPARQRFIPFLAISLDRLLSAPVFSKMRCYAGQIREGPNHRAPW